MLDEPMKTPASAEGQDTPQPRRRRRAASRPAGPPVEVAVSQTPTAPAAEAAAAAATPLIDGPEAPAAEGPGAKTAPAKRPARKRATRKTAAPDPLPEAPEAPDITDGPTPQAPADTAPQAPADTAPQAPADTAPAETAAAAARTPRKRASRKKVAEAPSEFSAPAESSEPSSVLARAESPEPTAASDREADKAPRTTRRPRKAVANPFAPLVAAEPEPVQTPPGPVLDDAAAVQGAADEVVQDDRPATGLDESETAGEVTSASKDDDSGHEDSDDQDSDDEDSDDQDSDDQDSDDQDSDDQDSDDQDDSDDDGRPRRRRRRRGGRRRRRGQGSDDSDDADDADHDADQATGARGRKADGQTDDASDPDESDDEGNDDDRGEGSADGRRRRRRRRRRGEASPSDDDENVEVVERVREPRRSKASDEVTGIDGSTRMEAKRQRRREGRAAGRRRAPILSEAEFLARRESVERTMVIRQNEELSQIAVLEDEVLVEHYVDRASAHSLIGNVYLGRVQNVLPSMEAAFIDIGRGRNAVLYAGEVDWDSFGSDGQSRKVEKVLKSGMPILVQVTKDPVGAKGARLTNNISLPGRYIVYAPGGHLSGISRKLSDAERKRLKDILADLVDAEASVIVRTAAEGASEEELVRDVRRLKAQWEAIEKKVKGGQAPQQLYAEPDPTVRIVRDLFTEDFSKLVIDGNKTGDDAYETVTAYVQHVAPHLAERIERWDPSRGEIFAQHRIDEQISKALERKVFLPSGGSLVIDRTEAMTVIDVNTGKFTGSGGNLEATVTSNNLEAAEEVVRQLRLRDIGGIIVIDFIDMVLPANRELLLRRLTECLSRDRTRHQVAEVTSLGLVQMTRKKIGTGLAEAFTEECEHCKGRGFEIHDMPVDTQAPADGGDRGGRGRGRRGKGRNDDNGGGSRANGGNSGPQSQDSDAADEPVKRRFPHPRPKGEQDSDQHVEHDSVSDQRVEQGQAPVSDPPQGEQAPVSDQQQAPLSDQQQEQVPAGADVVLPDLTPADAAEAPAKAPTRRTRSTSRRKVDTEATSDGDAPV